MVVLKILGFLVALMLLTYIAAVFTFAAVVTLWAVLQTPWSTVARLGRKALDSIRGTAY